MEQIRWIDSHCHPHLIVDALDGDKLALDEAVKHGIRMLCVSVEIGDYQKLAEYKKLHPYYVSFSLGQHPLHEYENVDWGKLESLVAADKNIVAVGEIGFDFNRDLNIQHNSFEAQAHVALEHNLPIILHTRDSGDGKIEAATQAAIKNASGTYGVFHCFTGSIALAEFAIENGWYISFSGIITFKNANNLREVAQHLANNGCLDKILIETDSPYLAPFPMRGKVNCPSYVKYVGEFLADLLEQDRAAFAKQIEKNYDSLFKARL